MEREKNMELLVRVLKTVLVAWLFIFSTLAAQEPETVPQESGRQQFEARCVRCHGADGTGGERGPDIVHLARVGGRRASSVEELSELIINGIPDAGMPAASLPEPQLNELATYVHSLISPAADHPTAGDPSTGERFFFATGQCSTCHMVRGRGGRAGPDLSNIAEELTVTEMEESLRDPSARIAPGYHPISVDLRDGRSIRGFSRNESNYDLQLQDVDGRFHFLLSEELLNVIPDEQLSMPPIKTDETELKNLMAYLTRLSISDSIGATDEWSPLTGLTFAEIAHPKPGEWPTYNGNLSGNRHTTLDQIHHGNVADLRMQWLFPVPTPPPGLQVTPVVVDGVMYVTTVNQAYALDAATGRQLWHYARPRTEGQVPTGDGALGKNRGVAVLGDRVFMVTDHAHLIALDRVTGTLLWDIEMADYREHYGSTSAPLVVNDLIISGVSGGDEGIRGFLAAYRASTGEEVWRFWTIPAPGEPLAETWIGRALEYGCGGTWLTGTYDPDVDLLYWTVGNPCPDHDGTERLGDNLYTSSVVALDPNDGTLRWYFQFTPHDLHDWDAQQTSMVVDAMFEGKPRQLLIQASRNGFFYVLDRTTGELLLATPFVKNLTWASGIDPDGRPKLLPGANPTVDGTRACPALTGATNWMSTAYNPNTGLYYVMALEKCQIYTQSSAWWQPGQSFFGGATRDIPGEPGKKYLRAINIQTGDIVWEYLQRQSAENIDSNSMGGLLSTATGIVFFCDDSGAFSAVDAETGELLWYFHTSQMWKASPMTYTVNGKQFIAIAAGMNILSFGLP